MIIYNVTVNIEDDIHDDWIKWMKDHHIPDVLKTGCFLESRLTRVMVQEEQGTTYSVQYLCESMDKLNEYADHFAPALQKDHRDRYEGKFTAFRITLDVIDILKP
jgi:hypothetical protein